MANIHWYPGHIAKAEKKLREQSNLVDVILEVIDARIPISSRYDNLDKITNQKPRLLVLNKADIADPFLTSQWMNYLKQNIGMPSIATSASSSKDLSVLIKEAVQLGKPKIDNMVAKGMRPRAIRAMVVGMPNVGKSSIINKLIRKGKAKVGPKAGVTKAAQWVRINPKLELLDTPGIIPMRLEDQSRAEKLAMVNSISENAYDQVEISKELIELLYKKYPEFLKKHYKLDEMTEIPGLEDIALSRKWLKPGKEADIKRCASVVLSDFRNGRIGRITLESVAQVQD